MVTSFWALETLADPPAAARECLRVLRPGGLAVLVCCTAPADLAGRVVAGVVERTVMRPVFGGRFLRAGERPWRAQTDGVARVAEHGLAAVATLRKPGAGYYGAPPRWEGGALPTQGRPQHRPADHEDEYDQGTRRPAAPAHHPTTHHAAHEPER